MIVDFRDRAKETEPCVWQCNCGNCSFTLYEDGRVACAKCDEFQNGSPHSVVVQKWTRKEE